MLDAVVVGGGVIGLSCAWRAAERGLDVCVLERGTVGAGVAVRPVKGQVVRLRGELPVQRMLRTGHLYVVPRQSGEVVLGATIEDRGFDTTVTAGATRELLSEGCRVLPALAELELVDVSAGLRPALPDDCPLVVEREAGVLI